jgi:hypothetical protein
LGRIAKAHHLSFVIGQTFIDPYGDPEQVTDGECLGACLLAAIGKSLPFAEEYKPTLESEEKSELLKNKANDDKLKGDAYPLHALQTPFHKIAAYAEAMGADVPWLEQLLPKKPGEVRYISYWAAARLGLPVMHITGEPPPPF